MTVYELIRRLTEFPAEDDICIRMYGTDKQIDEYIEDWHRAKQDGTRFDGHVEDVWKDDYPYVIIDCDMEDL